jgi:hypothetical protein
MSRLRWPAVLFSFIVVVGCGAPNAGAPSGEQRSAKVPGEAQAPAAPQIAGGKPAAADAAPIERKIIYSAHLDLVVKDLEATRQAVEQVVKDQNGYVAKSEVTGDVGSRRTATWTLKVPVEKFRATVNALAALGNPVRNSSDSQDVTEEFVDLQARIKNLKAEEETLNKLLKEEAVKLEDVLKIRDQIKGVRGEIERAEGRLKYLATMAAMSTVTLSAREDAAYTPPLPEAAPTFSDRIDTTFGGSLTALTNFGKAVVLFFVALAPWLPVIVVGLLLLRWVVKRLIVASAPQAKPAREPRRARRVESSAADPVELPEPEAPRPEEPPPP